MRQKFMERRNPGKRRWGLSAGFPLRDGDGCLVIVERRRLADRRLENMSLEDRLLMFSGQVSIDPDDQCG